MVLSLCVYLSLPLSPSLWSFSNNTLDDTAGVSCLVVIFLLQAENYQTLQTVGKKTSMDLDVSSMTEGTRYYVSVRAWNGAGLSTTLVSDGLVRDNTPPLPGSVFLSSRHASDHVTDDVTTLSASWHGFEDLESGVASYSLALFDVADLSTPVVDFVAVGFRTEHVFQGLSLQHRHR